MNVRFFPGKLDEVLNSQGVVDELGKVARDIAGDVQAPSKMRVSTRKGKGPRGAFAQVVMSGDGAIPIEYGSVNGPALSPLRSALARRRR